MACSSYVGDQSDQAHRDEQRSHACRSAGGRTATAAPDPSPEDQEGACCAACAALPSARARRADGCAPQSYTLEEELQLKKVVDREAKRAERENDRLKAERRARLEAQQKLFIQRQQRSQLERKVQELEDAYFAGGVSALQTTLRSIGPTGVTARVSARACCRRRLVRELTPCSLCSAVVSLAHTYGPRCSTRRTSSLADETEVAGCRAVVNCYQGGPVWGRRHTAEYIFPCHLP